MKLVITSQDGSFDVTQQVQQASVSGDYNQCARTLEFSLVSAVCQHDISDLKHDTHDREWGRRDFKNGDMVELYEQDKLFFSG